MDDSSNQSSESDNFVGSKYRFVKNIGSGGFSKVKLYQNVSTHQEVAIKVLNKERIKAENMEENVAKEINIMSQLKHPNIIQLYEVIETSTDILLVMEFAKSGELFDYILQKGYLQEHEARKVFQQTVSALEYCHQNNVVHRDIKPENLLMTSERNVVKLADFGLSNLMQNNQLLRTACGSLSYAAPEVLSGKLYGAEVDIWSCGVLLYAILCGRVPFEDVNISCLLNKITSGEYVIPSRLSPAAKDLIRKMLVVDPEHRIRIPEIRKHSWFQAS